MLSNEIFVIHGTTVQRIRDFLLMRYKNLRLLTYLLTLNLVKTTVHPTA